MNPLSLPGGVMSTALREFRLPHGLEVPSLKATGAGQRNKSVSGRVAM